MTPESTTRQTRAKKKSPARKGTKSKKAPTNDSKTAAVLVLLRRKQGATMPELIEATGWQVHSVPGFLSGTIAEPWRIFLPDIPAGLVLKPIVGSG